MQHHGPAHRQRAVANHETLWLGVGQAQGASQSDHGWLPFLRHPLRGEVSETTDIRGQGVHGWHDHAQGLPRYTVSTRHVLCCLNHSKTSVSTRKWIEVFFRSSGMTTPYTFVYHLSMLAHDQCRAGLMLSRRSIGSTQWVSYTYTGIVCLGTPERTLLSHGAPTMST